MTLINTIMNFYTPFENEDVNILQQKVLNLISPESIEKEGLVILNNSESFYQIPELDSFLRKLNLLSFVNMAALHVLEPNRGGNIHVDVGAYRYSLNIPILNCNNTYVEYYEPTAPPTIVTKEYMGKTVRLRKFDQNKCKLILRKETIDPYIIDTQFPHKVVSENPTGTRVMLLLRLNNSFKL